ncbi:MAG: DUF2169 domain-containing protein [Burkholderiaceae bacterium]|nr:DUF2169 domain-containing protein [Burkholderiaceae bacterium]
MELINATRMQAGYTMGLEPSGRELLVVVIKGTFTLPREGERIGLHPDQEALAMADTFAGEPGLSAPVYEADFAPRKKRCDVLLLGSAHAPAGRPATSVPIGLRVGEWRKTFNVQGERFWDAGLTGIRATPPVPFTRRAFSYDVAFGGADTNHDDASKHAWYAPNPVGRGFHRHLRSDWVDGRPLPDTEALDDPVTRPDGAYAPMACGPIGRGWAARAKFAGTYDDKWLDEHFPFLPPDFDEAYYQSAPADQQLALGVGGQRVVLANLTPDGGRVFDLPAFEAPVVVFPKNGAREDLLASLDTIVFEPDLERFTMSWRVARPLKRSIFEVAQVLVGRKGTEWWSQREEVAFSIPLDGVPADEAASTVTGARAGAPGR